MIYILMVSAGKDSTALWGKGIIRKLVPTPIREMVAWARTSHGGKRLAMFPEPSGCARWGICEAPARREGGSYP